MRRRRIKSVPELVALIRDRRDELDIPHTNIDAIAGIPDGYTSKLLAPVPIKNFGAVSLSAVLGALGLGIVRIEIVEDAAAIERVSGRWVRRRRPPVVRKPAERCVAEGAQQMFTFADTESADMARTKLIAARVDEDLGKRVKAAAEKQRRPVSQFLNNLIGDALEQPQDAEGAENVGDRA